MLSLTRLLVLASSAHALLLPDPTGPFSVGVSTSTLTDETRMDPFAPADAPEKRRRIQVSTFVPLNATITPCAARTAPYMTPLVAADYGILASTAGLPNSTFASLTVQSCEIPPAKPCARSRIGRREATQASRPLLIFSPGFGQSRLLYSAMARSLASEGYIVVTVDHPYDATVVEFPDGSFVRAANISSDDIAAVEMVVQVRATDISFLLDQLRDDPALQQPIENSSTQVDFDRVLMFGHSLGGAASAATMLSDARIQGGVNLDGRFFDPATELGADRPFLNVGRPDHGATDPTWDAFYAHMRVPGEAVEVAVAGTTHSSFTDYPVILAAMNLTAASSDGLAEFLGTGDWARANGIVTRLVAAFAEYVFGHTVPEILRGEDGEFPEVQLVRSQL